jgi:hypothetical protein
MEYKTVFLLAILALLGLAVCVIVMQSDPVTQELRLETARKQVEYREKAVAAREKAEQEIATIKESAAAKKAQLLEPREKPREIEAPPKIEGPGFFEKPTASASTPELDLTPPPVPTPASAPALTPPVPVTIPRPIIQAKCDYCRSLRTVPCQACINTGGFSTGLIPCPECRTARTITCPACSGNWDRVCTRCSGKGYILVKEYRSIRDWRTGETRGIYVPVKYDCKTCGSEGRIILCRKCTKGRIQCPTCKGAGRIGACPVCKGEKRVPCPKCSVSPTK